MRDYKTNNYRGYKRAPEVVFIAVVMAYIVASMSVEEISRFFGF